MSQETVLVIDDSSTIRHLVDSELSQAGYRVVMAATAEEGVARAEEVRPDVIILDHQLPGTTGFQVCGQLLELPEVRQTPVVISSTLRKKAYAEYTDLANVVDMLPKPYTGELLRTTVANALDTGAMIVRSQSEGTAVPEVMRDLENTALSGEFSMFGLREVLDFLNNGSKRGVLEAQGQRGRVWFYLNDGRIQGVTATGIDTDYVANSLPESLEDLGPVLKFTLGGRMCSEVDGLVELLDRKVLDPRLLRKLLRHQSAMLTQLCFAEQLTSFRFQADAPVPSLVSKLNLDVSLLALLVDGALACDASVLPAETQDTVYVRSHLHGQSLDRSGLSATHMKVLGLLAEPVTAAAVARKLGCPDDEARRVLHGFTLAELAQRTKQQPARTVIALESDQQSAQQIRHVLSDASAGYSGRVVRDGLALQLLLKRSNPDAVLVAADDEECRALAASIPGDAAANVRWIGIGEPAANATDALQFEAFVARPLNQVSLVETLNSVFERTQGRAPQTVA